MENSLCRLRSYKASTSVCVMRFSVFAFKWSALVELYILFADLVLKFLECCHFPHCAFVSGNRHIFFNGFYCQFLSLPLLKQCICIVGALRIKPHWYIHRCVQGVYRVCLGTP